MNAKQVSANSRHKLSVGIVNLGCVRNTVDSEFIVGRLNNKGYPLREAPRADVVIINTCAFIEDAKRESIDAILDLIALKKKGIIKKIIVAGCLAQRYSKELQKEFKDIDAFCGVLRLCSDNGLSPSMALTPKHYRYLKICESCFNICSFCAIPRIKGKFRSRPTESILNELKFMDEQNVREVNIVGQDITSYGMDLYRKRTLASLLRKMARQTHNIRWMRLLYAFPSYLDDALLDVIASEKKICNYIDLPLQHINNKILEKMNRPIKAKQINALIKRIRKKIPQAVLRTSFIVGFPGETEGQFQELLDFVKDARFDKVGVFPFSPEEGTRAATMSGQISQTVKQKRYNRLMQTQQQISKSLLKRRIGKSEDVLLDETAEAIPAEKSFKIKRFDYVGRSYADAPEVDGVIYVTSKKKHAPGDFVNVKITDSYEYDLTGEVA